MDSRSCKNSDHRDRDDIFRGIWVAREVKIVGSRIFRGVKRNLQNKLYQCLAWLSISTPETDKKQRRGTIQAGMLEVRKEDFNERVCPSTASLFFRAAGNR